MPSDYCFLFIHVSLTKYRASSRPENMAKLTKAETVRATYSSFGLSFKASLLLLTVTFLFPTLKRVFWTVFPVFLPDTSVQSSTIEGNSLSCGNINFTATLDIDNVRNFDEAMRIAVNLKGPVVFRKFIENSKEIWAKIFEENKNATFYQPEVEVKSFGNMFLPGTRVYLDRSRNISLGDFLIRKGNGNSYYASFTSFLQPDTIEKILGLFATENFVKDTNFISNFPADVFATPLHSATYVESYSLQLVGRKLWVWVPPSEMEQIGVVSTHTANFPYGGSESSYLGKFNNIQYSLVDEGMLTYTLV